jgi:hypothetical protein
MFFFFYLLGTSDNNSFNRDSHSSDQDSRSVNWDLQSVDRDSHSSDQDSRSVYQDPHFVDQDSHSTNVSNFEIERSNKIKINTYLLYLNVLFVLFRHK